jgi:hypothetical protein
VTSVTGGPASSSHSPTASRCAANNCYCCMIQAGAMNSP